MDFPRMLLAFSFVTIRRIFPTFCKALIFILSYVVTCNILTLLIIVGWDVDFWFLMKLLSVLTLLAVCIIVNWILLANGFWYSIVVFWYSLLVFTLPVFLMSSLDNLFVIDILFLSVVYMVVLLFGVAQIYKSLTRMFVREQKGRFISEHGSGNSIILLLAGSQGRGHLVVAENIAQELVSMSKHNRIIVLNVLDYVPKLRWFLEEAWEYLSLKMPSIYRVIHRLILSGISGITSRIGQKIASDILKDLSSGDKIKTVIACHPLAACVASVIKKKNKDLFLGVVLTDFFLHRHHVYPEVDYYFVPEFLHFVDVNKSEISKKCITTGIPISRNYTKKRNRSESCKRLGISPKQFNVFVNFGGNPFLRQKVLFELFVFVNFFRMPIQILAAGPTFGELDDLKVNPSSLVKIRRVEEKNIPEVIAVADIMIGKAGGVSISEALTSQLHIGIWDTKPGQEDYNAKVFIENHIATKIGGLREALRDFRNLERLFVEKRGHLPCSHLKRVGMADFILANLKH
ncbi:MAG: hypothetical protein ABII94_03675 [Patescibacteria group bacterium]